MYMYIVHLLVWVINSYIILTDKYILSHPVGSLVVLAYPSSPNTLPKVINYTLHLSDKITDPVDLLFVKILLL